MKVSICAPSYKRPTGILTKNYLPGMVRYYVAPNEYESYMENNPDEQIVACDEGIQGNLCRVRNYIMDQEFKAGADSVLIIDDDMSGLFYWEENSKNKIEPDDFVDVIKKYSLMCKEFGFYFWGVNINQDKQVYREYTPFSTVSYIGGPFQCFLKGGECRYDERLPLKEDYDMTLQQCNKYRGCLRVNKYFYVVKQSEQQGGAASIRNYQKEKEQFELLQAKWGKSIVKSDTADRSHNLKSVKTRIDYNPIISIPIKGV